MATMVRCMLDEGVTYGRFDQASVTMELLEACCSLFSGHYGHWAMSGVEDSRRGKRIRLPQERLRRYFEGGQGFLATAEHGGVLVGYAIAVRIKVPSGIVSWVTQLVVHEAFRNRLVGSKMLKSIWGDSHDYAWGIASANPFAIRALEKATRRRCSPRLMAGKEKVIRRVVDHVPYLRGREMRISAMRSTIDSQFFQDLSGVAARKDVASIREAWLLGDLAEGEEWLAMTFREQTQTKWSDEEFEQFIRLSGDMVKLAYERMALRNPEAVHAWASPEHADREIAYLLPELGVPSGSSILDFGCGSGRHCRALARRGMSVVGIDFSEASVERARAGSSERERYEQGDCRTVTLPRDFDAGLCLYDVVGSFVDQQSNERILGNLARHLRPGAVVAFSVLSYAYVERIARHKVVDGNVQDRLNALRSSDLMQRSGEIFDPEFFLLDIRARVVYRRETFENDGMLRFEDIIADRRYTFDDLTEMCLLAGLRVVRMGYVRAGRFELVENVDGEPTKEILVIATKALV